MKAHYASLVLAVAALAAAQNIKPPARPAPDPFDAIVAEARSAPPEVAATVLRLLLETPGLSSQRRNELVDALLFVSGLVQEQFPRQFMAPPLNSQELMIYGSTMRFPVDRLSIRCLVIRNLASRDRALTRRVLDESRPAAIPRVTCKDALLPNPMEFYATTAAVLKDLFTPEDRHFGRDVYFVMNLISSASSSTQLPGLIDLIRRFETSPAQKRLLCSALSERLRTIRDGDPVFTFAAISGLGVKMRDLVRSPELGPANAELLASYRAYLVANSQAERCASFIFRTERTPMDWFARFNDLVAERNGQDAKIARLTAEETATRFPRVSSMQRQALAAGPALRLSEQNTRLAFADTREGLTIAVRQSADWTNRAEAALADLDAWRSSDDETQFFREKAHLYQRLFVVARVNEAVIERVVNSFVGFLGSSPAVRTNPFEWFASALQLLESDSATADAFSEDERDRRDAGDRAGPRLRPIILKAFLASGSPELRLIARASQLAASPAKN